MNSKRGDINGNMYKRERDNSSPLREKNKSPIRTDLTVGDSIRYQYN